MSVVIKPQDGAHLTEGQLARPVAASGVKDPQEVPTRRNFEKAGPRRLSRRGRREMGARRHRERWLTHVCAASVNENGVKIAISEDLDRGATVEILL